MQYTLLAAFQTQISYSWIEKWPQFIFLQFWPQLRCSHSTSTFKCFFLLSVTKRSTTNITDNTHNKNKKNEEIQRNGSLHVRKQSVDILKRYLPGSLVSIAIFLILHKQT